MSRGEYPAPAKLNLFLHVLGRRDDGYHLLQTVFRFIDYGDSLRFRVRDDAVLALEAPVPGIPERDNLVLRAARLLQQEGGTGLGADIGLEKRLPLGGGLGGGSSDAATTLLALNRLWGLDLPRGRLLSLAARLGADVPVFVFGETAFAEGIGEVLQPFRAPPAWYLVITPPVAVSTAEIFASPELTRNSNPIKIADFSMDKVRNDLEPVVRRRHPAVADCLDWLASHREARMTGSGACVFAEFESEQAATGVLAAAPPGIAGFVARGLDRHPLWHLAH